mmetsp:Transcript_3699/g.7075  ORF Transcript_3699/g.7075 Transcript_3699/m.7075 type:complete len:142 (-) Transcript_3699:34-459(-)
MNVCMDSIYMDDIIGFLEGPLESRIASNMTNTAISPMQIPTRYVAIILTALLVDTWNRFSTLCKSLYPIGDNSTVKLHLGNSVIRELLPTLPRTVTNVSNDELLIAGICISPPVRVIVDPFQSRIQVQTKESVYHKPLIKP